MSTGSPGQLFHVGMPVVLDGHWQGDVFSSFQIMVQHGSTYVEAHPRQVQERGAQLVNIALGQSALLLALLGARSRRRHPAGRARHAGGRSLLRAGQGYIWLVVAGAVLATVAMQRALITHDFTLVYVDNNDSTFTPLIYRITAMWSDLAGSILLWALVLSGYLAAMWIRFRNRADEPVVVWAKVVGYIVAAFFFGLMLTVSDPFTRVHGAVPTQGPAPTPCCRTGCWWRSTRRCCTSGLVGFTVPFCFAIASLVTGQDGRGLALRDPPLGHLCLDVPDRRRGAGRLVELPGPRLGRLLVVGPGRELRPAALADGDRLPALGHGPAAPGMLRVWNLSLVLATFSLTILGTFFTRSGVLVSVHSFTDDGGVGPALLVFFGVVVAICIGLLAWRGDQLRSPGRDRDAGVARRCFPGQQPSVRRLRFRRVARAPFSRFSSKR